FPLALVIGALVAAEIAAVTWVGFPTIAGGEVAGAAEGASNTKALGILLYTEYLYPIQVAAVILLAAKLTALALTLPHRKDSKAINPGDQVRVRAADRLVVVPMAATTRPADPAPAAQEEGKAS